MKKLFFTSMITVFMLLCTNGLQAQSMQTTLNQVELMKQFVGSWQRDVGKDTTDLWEVQQFEKAFVTTVYRVINGKKSFTVAENFGFSSKEGKFKALLLFPTGGYQTWIASFISENKWSGDYVRNLNPEAILGKFEVILENPQSMTLINYNVNGVKTGEFKYTKIK
jgi:hypothetical protein